jgi:hypothetical protein
MGLLALDQTTLYLGSRPHRKSEIKAQTKSCSKYSLVFLLYVLDLFVCLNLFILVQQRVLIWLSTTIKNADLTHLQGYKVETCLYYYWLGLSRKHI